MGKITRTDDHFHFFFAYCFHETISRNQYTFICYQSDWNHWRKSTEIILIIIVSSYQIIIAQPGVFATHNVCCFLFFLIHFNPCVVVLFFCSACRDLGIQLNHLLYPFFVWSGWRALQILSIFMGFFWVIHRDLIFPPFKEISKKYKFFKKNPKFYLKFKDGICPIKWFRSIELLYNFKRKRFTFFIPTKDSSVPSLKRTAFVQKRPPWRFLSRRHLNSGGFDIWAYK